MPAHEPAPDSKRERSPAVAITIAVVLALPVLYVISEGPVLWLGDQGYLPDEAWPYTLAFYRPLRFLQQNCESFRGARNWYLSLFRG